MKFENILVSEKNGIAQTAAKLIDENDSIMIASGTTVQALAKFIVPKNKLTVITSSLHVVLHLINHKNIDINSKNNYGETPLHYALQYCKNEEILKMLVNLSRQLSLCLHIQFVY